MEREPDHADATAPVEIEGDGWRVLVHELTGDRRRVHVEVLPGRSPESWETGYPVELIRAVLERHGPDGLSEEIRRDEDPEAMAVVLRHAMLNYVPFEAFSGKRLLDFGCGSGASTMVLARMFPDAEIVGVDIDEPAVVVAQVRARHYGLPNVSFVTSPDPNALPAELGSFDYIVLSTVWEHLRPSERRSLGALLWSVRQSRGVVLLNQTPYRWWPIEEHTTGIPLLNYPPAPVAARLANRFGRSLSGRESWNELLRRSIRGGTEREMLGAFAGHGGGRPVLLRPIAEGMRDGVDVWYAASQAARAMTLKVWIRRLCKVASAATRTTVVPILAVAVEKRPL